MTSLPPPPPSSKTTQRQLSISGHAAQENGNSMLAGLATPLMPLSVAPPLNSIPSTSGVLPKTDNDRHLEGREASASEEEEKSVVSASFSSESDDDEETGGRENSFEGEDEQFVAENVSSKISNRSSPSVLSATIHQWPGYEEESHGLLDNNEEAASDEENSENDAPDDPWKISADQRGWYLSLFLRLQPDVHGYIEGKDARVFFENSQLPLHDLGEIWNCSDVDRDGRLNLGEFCYAMHLSVARRHGLPLPSHLPSSLKNSTRHILMAAEGHSADPNIFSSGDYTHQPEWTKFSESPRNRGPVQFRSTVETESKLPHPVPLKATTKSATPVRDGRSFSTGTTNPGVVLISDTSGIPGLPGTPGQPMAPPPPPRSFHSRSASLDLQGQMNNSANKVLPAPSAAAAAPPQLPPRSSPIISKRFDSATSESESEMRTQTGHCPSVSDSQPKKPPRISKTPTRTVSFAPSGEGGDKRQWNPSVVSSLPPLPPLLDTSDIVCPSLREIERMKTADVNALLLRLKILTEGISRQNVDLQQQLTEVVLKKRTAEVNLANEVQKEKNTHK